MFSRYTHFKTHLKITISPGQALLILINKYRSNLGLTEELKELYLTGVEDKNSAARITELLQDEALRPYNISFEPTVINEDPTRRFFESYLAYFTLFSSIKKIDSEKLEYTLIKLYKLLDKKERRMIKFYFRDNNPAPEGSSLVEFQDAADKINNHHCFASFSENDKENMLYLNLIAYLALYPVQNDNLSIPLDLYNTGYFKPKHRGRIIKPEEEQEEVRSCNLGLMKSYMPLSKADLLFDEEGSIYTRIADKNTFEPDSRWTQDNFSKLVHPFSASISGTMLAFIRILAHFYDNEELLFAEEEEFKNLFRSYISLLLFNGGGHTLNEYVAPIEFTEVQKFFSRTEGFYDTNLRSLFLTDNEVEFELALKHAIEYNQMVINKRFVNSEVADVVATIEPEVEPEFLHKKLEVLKNLNAIKKTIANDISRSFYLRDAANDFVKSFRSALSALRRPECNSEEAMDTIIQDLHSKLSEKIDSDIKELMVICGIKVLSSHKALHQEYNFFCQFIDEFKVQSLYSPTLS